MASDDPEDPRRRATPQVGWTHKPKDLGMQAALSRSAVTPMPAKLKAAQAISATQKTTERDLPASATARKNTTPSARQDRGDRYSDLNTDRVEVVAPPTRSPAHSNLPTVNEPYDLEGALGPHLAWLEDDGRVELMGHLKRGDHPRALAMLGSAAKRYPRIVSITRAIQLVERAAIARLTKRVGDFESIAVVAGRPGPSHEAISLAALIDGVRAIDEIVRLSTLPRLRTLELLDDLIRRGAVEIRDPYVQSSGKVPSGASPSPRRATPLATRSPISSNPDPRPASVPPQRLGAGGNPFGGMRSKRDVDAPLRSDTTHRSADLGVRSALAAAQKAGVGANPFPDLEEDVGARVTIPGPIPGEENAWTEPTPSPKYATISPRQPAARVDDDGPSIAVESIDPASSRRGNPAVEESALEEGLPAVLAFGLLSLPVRTSSSPASPRANDPGGLPAALGAPSASKTPPPSSVVASSGAAMTEPEPTLVTPKEPEDVFRNDGRVKMETLKSAPNPEVIRAAERSDRDARSAVEVRSTVEVRSARKRDLDGTMESPVQAPPPPVDFPPLPLKVTSQPPGAIARSDAPRAKSEPPRSEAPASQRVTRVPLDGAGVAAAPTDASPRASSRPAAAALPEVRTIVREATPGWFMPVMALVGVAVIGSAVAVYLSLRAASEPSAARDPGTPHLTATTPLTPTTVAPKETASVSPAVPLPTTMHVRIEATPRAARVTLDKVLLTAHPVDEIIPRDGKEHEIRVELAGYETFKKTFTGDGEISLTITLKQLAPTTVAAPQPTTPPTNTAPAQTPTTTPTKPEDVYPAP